jgi:hypothetical protein
MTREISSCEQRQNEHDKVFILTLRCGSIRVHSCASMHADNRSIYVCVQHCWRCMCMSRRVRTRQAGCQVSAMDQECAIPATRSNASPDFATSTTVESVSSSMPATSMRRSAHIVPAGCGCKCPLHETSKQPHRCCMSSVACTTCTKTPKRFD